MINRVWRNLLLERKEKNEDMDNILMRYKDVLEDRYVKGSSYTLSAIHLLKPALEYLKDKNIKVLMDLGCGYGVLTLIIADFVGTEKVYAADIDRSRLSFLNEAKDRSLVKEVVALPHDFCELINIDEKVQLVTSLGSLEHVTCWDDVFENIKKILADQGYLLISMPNLSSWVNRLALLLGYQPRDLEISTKKLYGVAPPFKNMGQ